MGVGVSKRSDDFPMVIQHDTVLRPVDCGGPVVDLTAAWSASILRMAAARRPTACRPSR